MSRKFWTAAVVGSLLALGAGSQLQAGSVNGPRYDLGARGNAYSTNVYYIAFYGGELAEVLVQGDGDTDLDLYIYDEFGNLVASDADFTDVCLAQWFPRWTGTFRIEVVNRGGVYNRYDLVTN